MHVSIVQERQYIAAVCFASPSRPKERRKAIRRAQVGLAAWAAPSWPFSPLALFLAYRASPACVARGSGAPGGAGACEAPWARLRDVPGPLARRSRVPCDRDARLSALHLRRSPPRWLNSGPGFLGRGLSPYPSPAGSLQSGRSAARPGSRSRPGTRLRASSAGTAPRSAFGTVSGDAPSLSEVMAIWICS